jgi:hypothetical protein
VGGFFIPSRSQLNDTAKVEWWADFSLPMHFLKQELVRSLWFYLGRSERWFDIGTISPLA